LFPAAVYLIGEQIIVIKKYCHYDFLFFYFYQMTNPRNLTADLLKGFAVIFMVQVHILELFAKQEIFDGALGSVLLFLGGPPAAPVFMIVMGYYIAHSNKSTGKNISRGLKIIGLGLLLNFGLNFHLFIKIFNGSINVSPWPYLFGVDILFLAGLSIIIIALIKPVFKNNPLSYFLLILIIYSIVEFIPDQQDTGPGTYLWAFIFSKTWWSYFPVIPWLAYPLSGVIFHIIEPRIIVVTLNRFYNTGIIIVSGLILIFTMVYGINIASDLHSYYHHSYMYFLFIINFMIFWSGIMKFVSTLPKNRFLLAVCWMGENVTAFYVIQWIIIGNIATALYKTQSLYDCIFWFVIVIICTSILTFLWNLIKTKESKNSSSIVIK